MGGICNGVFFVPALDGSVGSSTDESHPILRSAALYHHLLSDRHSQRYAKVEKIAGGELEECAVLSGVMFNKDITHPRMRRRIQNPRVVLLDCPLEYKKGTPRGKTLNHSS